jgi:hypothetical protein
MGDRGPVTDMDSCSAITGAGQVEINPIGSDVGYSSSGSAQAATELAATLKASRDEREHTATWPPVFRSGFTLGGDPNVAWVKT